MYTVDDEFGNQISTGLQSYDAALQVARRYMSAHKDAPAVTVYGDPGDSWEITRAEVLS